MTIFHATRGTCAMCGLVVYHFEGVSDEAAQQITEAALLASLSHLMTVHGTPRIEAVTAEWVVEAPEAEARRALGRETAAVALQERLHEWSVAHHGVAWWPRASEVLWRMATSGFLWDGEAMAQEAREHDIDDGRADTSPEEVAALYRLAQEARGWWVLVPPADAPTFLALDTWERLYEAYMMQNEQTKAAREHAAAAAEAAAAAAPAAAPAAQGVA